MKNLSDIEHIREFDNLDLIAQQVVEGFITGLHKSPFHGFSVEFAEHRLYNAGESTKHIDWKLFARSEKLFVKRYEEETNLRGQIIIDVSSSMLFPYKSKEANKLLYSVYCAASLIYLLRKQRDAVGLSLFSDEVIFHSEPRLSQVHVQVMYNQLRLLMNSENIPMKKTTNTATCLHQLAETMHKRSLVVIFSDMFGSNDPELLFPALQHLRYAKHEVILFHVTDHKLEQQFQFSNRPYKFVDLETGGNIKLNPNEIRDTYVKNVEEYVNELKLKCGQYQIDFVEADINSDFSDVLTAYLLKRQKYF
ncbi:MAG: DUF58 domain-containing protein [Bacteroidales bacterium]|nr:DUF58 domain-containing protein [Bacteroidales bacterium]HOY37811.1 DUF58 domain-containing protein [Bacteroidales bacterium]HQP04191.1 DUF58 domain-containing protein [Bacteroidales bacterium]